jgi:site-specific recombinase XerD
MPYSLEKLFQGFLLSREANHVTNGTLETYRVMYASLVESLPLDALHDAALIESTDLHAWAASMRDRYATATRDQRIAKAKAFFNWCQAEGFLEGNPALGLQRPKADWQPDPLTEEEIGRLMDATRSGRCSIRNRAIVCVLLDSGLRNSELCNLRPGDVTMGNGQIRIRDALKQGKPRTVIIGKRAKEALWRWMMARPDDAEFLFCTEQGRPLDRVRLRVIISQLGKQAGFRCYPHRLRHTFALMYLKLGGDPYSLQYLLGHEDMGMTRQYVKISSHDARDLYRSPLDSLTS